MKRTSQHPVNVLRTRNVVVAPAGGVAVLQKRVASQGFSRLVGGLHANGGTPAVGYPRVCQYADQATATGPSRIDVLTQDALQPGTNYPIDVAIMFPYVGIEYQEAALGPGCTILEAQAELRW